MKFERLGHHDGLKEVSLELVDADGDRDDDKRDHRTVFGSDEGDKRGETARHGGSDKWNKAGDKNDNREWQGQRHPENEEPQSNEECVDEGDNRRPPNVTAEHTNGGVSDAATPGEPCAVERPKEELPDRVAVFEEEEEDHEDQNGSGDDAGNGGHTGKGTRAELRARHEVDDSIPCFLDLLLVDRQRPADEVIVELIEALHRGGRQLVPLVANGKDDQRDDTAEDDNPAEERDPRRQDRGHEPAQPANHGGCGRGDDDGNQHRDDNQLELDHAEYNDGSECQQRKNLEAADADCAQPIGPQRTEGRAFPVGFGSHASQPTECTE